jgi:hypothetical protein
MVGLATWLVNGLINGPVVGLGVGLASGLVVGLVVGLTSRRRLTDEPAHANLKLKNRVKLLARQLASGLRVGLAVGLGVGLAVGLGVELAGGLEVKPQVGLAEISPVSMVVTWLQICLVVGLVFGLVFGLMFGLTEWVGTPSRADWANTPQSTYKATRTLTVLQISLSGLVVWLISRQPIGLVIGLVIGLFFVSSAAWLNYLLTTCWLAASGKLPLRLMDFLDDAYRLGLLRTVGPAYQFRHAEFQDHLVRTAGTRGPTD